MGILMEEKETVERAATSVVTVIKPNDPKQQSPQVPDHIF